MIEKSGPIDQEPLYQYCCPCGWIGMKHVLLSHAENDEIHHRASHGRAADSFPGARNVRWVNDDGMIVTAIAADPAKAFSIRPDGPMSAPHDAVDCHGRQCVCAECRPVSAGGKNGTL